MKRFTLSFFLVLILCSAGPGCMLELAFYANREQRQKQTKLLDSLNHLPQFKKVAATTELQMYAHNQLGYVYVLQFDCTSHCSLDHAAELNRYIQKEIIGTSTVLEGVRFDIQDSDTCFSQEFAPLTTPNR